MHLTASLPFVRSRTIDEVGQKPTFYGRQTDPLGACIPVIGYEKRDSSILSTLPTGEEERRSFKQVQ